VAPIHARAGGRRILLATIALDGMAGGLELNIVRLANFLAGTGLQVELVTFDRPGARAFYAIDARVRWHQVGRTRPHSAIGFTELLALIGRIRSLIRNGGVPTIVCFHHGILFRFIAAARGTDAALVCSERNSLRLYEHVRQRKWSVNFLLLAAVRRITVQFPAYREDYPGWLRRRIRVIPNPVEAARRAAAPAVPGAGGRFTLITVGRLCGQKNQGELIDAFARLAGEHPQWDLRIVGDGEDLERLRHRIAASGLRDRIDLHGKSSQVGDLLADAHLFCLPSLWEGFPNALAEAMAAGLPAVVFADCAGASELVRPGETGLHAARGRLPESLGALMSSPELRVQFGAAARAATESYRPADTFRRWLELLEELEAKR
jgi:glycosyltransferase involved in cell wall biosynthesis